MLVISISTENDAFCNGNYRFEIARILRGLADDIESHNECGIIRDINGNTVGILELGEDK